MSCSSPLFPGFAAHQGRRRGADSWDAAPTPGVAQMTASLQERDAQEVPAFLWGLLSESQHVRPSHAAEAPEAQQPRRSPRGQSLQPASSTTTTAPGTVIPPRPPGTMVVVMEPVPGQAAPKRQKTELLGPVSQVAPLAPFGASSGLGGPTVSGGTPSQKTATTSRAAAPSSGGTAPKKSFDSLGLTAGDIALLAIFCRNDDMLLAQHPVRSNHALPNHRPVARTNLEGFQRQGSTHLVVQTRWQ